MTDVSEFTMDKYDGTVYTYPPAAQWTGRILAASTIACIPIGAVVAVIRARVGRIEGSQNKKFWDTLYYNTYD